MEPLHNFREYAVAKRVERQLHAEYISIGLRAKDKKEWHDLAERVEMYEAKNNITKHTAISI